MPPSPFTPYAPMASSGDALESARRELLMAIQASDKQRQMEAEAERLRSALQSPFGQEILSSLGLAGSKPTLPPTDIGGIVAGAQGVVGGMSPSIGIPSGAAPPSAEALGGATAPGVRNLGMLPPIPITVDGTGLPPRPPTPMASSAMSPSLQPMVPPLPQLRGPQSRGEAELFMQLAPQLGQLAVTREQASGALERETEKRRRQADRLTVTLGGDVLKMQEKQVEELLKGNFKLRAMALKKGGGSGSDLETARKAVAEAQKAVSDSRSTLERAMAASLDATEPSSDRDQFLTRLRVTVQQSEQIYADRNTYYQMLLVKARGAPAASPPRQAPTSSALPDFSKMSDEELRRLAGG